MYAPGEVNPETGYLGDLKKIDFTIDSAEREADAKKAFNLLKTTWSKQNNKEDRMTRFIYKCKTIEEVLELNKKIPVETRDYAIRRYFNKTISETAEDIFCSYNICERERNMFHKFIDFYILGIPFDLKVSSYPARFNLSRDDFKNEREYRNELIRWLYKNQSREQREHYKNRLFIVCKSGDGKTPLNNNKLKSELKLFEDNIVNYLEYSLKRYYSGLKVFNEVDIDGSGTTVLSDLILIED